MSLINKMLQDLDARRSEVTGNGTQSGQIRVVPKRRVAVHTGWWVAIGLGTALVAVIIWAVLRPSLATTASRLDQSQPIKPLSIAGGQKINEGKAGSSTPVVAEAKHGNTLIQTQITSSPTPASSASSASLSAQSETKVAAKETTKEDKTDVAKDAANKALVATTVAKTKEVFPPPIPELPRFLPAEKQWASAPSVKMAEKVAEKSPEIAVPVSLNKQFKELTPAQKAENEYRKAVLLMQQGKGPESISSFEHVLQTDPMHTGARQALVRALLENSRQSDALRRAKEGLDLDPAQPALAMILSRLQLEKGDLKSAIGTLERSYRYASDRPDYLAFLAALLQRDNRNKEAAEYYMQALQTSPHTGVWWMGLGISLQADSRAAEAQEAFSRARATNTLTPELLAFVESKLVQLQR